MRTLGVQDTIVPNRLKVPTEQRQDQPPGVWAGVGTGALRTWVKSPFREVGGLLSHGAG